MGSKLSSFFQSQFNVKFFHYAPPSVSRAYLHLLGKGYYLFNREEKLLIESNIRDFLGERNPKEIKRITKEAFRGIFEHYFEKMFAAYREFESVKRYVERNFSVKNIEVIDKALMKGRGVILVTAHFGAVEFIPWVLGLKGYPISVILEYNAKVLKEALGQQITHCDVELMSESDGGSVFFKALRSLKRNRILMTECDEVDKWRRRKNQTIQLFGKTLYFDDTLNVLSKRTHSPVVGVFLKRTGNRSYTLICEDVSVEREVDDTAKNVFYLWQKYVSESPEQWYQWKKWNNMKVAS